MSIKLEMDAASQAALKGISAHLDSAMQEIAREGQRDALTMAMAGAEAGIYATEQGKTYKRTFRFLESIAASSQVQGDTIIVEIINTAEYSSFLEYGTHGSSITPKAAQELSEALGIDEKPLYLGRSGIDYIKPAPTITRAAVFTGLRMAERLGKKLQKI